MLLLTTYMTEGSKNFRELLKLDLSNEGSKHWSLPTVTNNFVISRITT